MVMQLLPDAINLISDILLPPVHEALGIPEGEAEEDEEEDGGVRVAVDGGDDGLWGFGVVFS